MAIKNTSSGTLFNPLSTPNLSTPAFKPDTSLSTFEIKDNQGNIIDRTNTLPEAFKGKEQVYRYSDGSYGTKSYETPRIALDQNSGKITVEAPDFLANREAFKTELGDTLKTLSAAYKSDPEYKFPKVDANGVETGETQSIQEIIDTLNAGADTEGSLASYAEAAYQIDQVKEQDRQIYGDDVDMTDDEVIIRTTVALGENQKDDSRQAVSDAPGLEAFRSLSSYDPKTGTVEYKDLMENAWNRDKFDDDTIKKWEMILSDRLFGDYEYTSGEEKARDIALYEFMNGRDPDVNWLRGVTEGIGSVFEGLMGAGANAVVGAAEVLDGFSTAIRSNPVGDFVMTALDYTTPFGITGKIYEGAANLSRQALDNFDKQDIKILGISAEQLKTLQDNFSDVAWWRQSYDEVTQERQVDRQLLSDASAAWHSVGRAIGDVVIMVGLSSMASAGISRVIGSVAKGTSLLADAVNSSSAIARTAGTMAYGARSMALLAPKALGSILNIASNVANNKIATGATRFMLESIVDGVITDPTATRELLVNGNLTDEARNMLVENFVFDGVALGVSTSVLRSVTSIKNTAGGRALSDNLSRLTARAAYNVNSKVTDLRVKLHGYESLQEWVDNLKSRGTRSASRKADALVKNAVINEVRRMAYTATDDIADTVKAANVQADEAIKYEQVEVSIDEINRRGRGYVREWLETDAQPLFRDATNQVLDAYQRTLRAEDASPLAGKAAYKARGTKTVSHLLSQETINYVLGKNKLEVLNILLERSDKKLTARMGFDALTLSGEKRKAIAIEISDLKKKIKAFTDVATPELKVAADELVVKIRLWNKEANNLFARLGVISQVEIDELRANGIWGNNGELYIRTQRAKTNTSNYKVVRADNLIDKDTLIELDRYRFGSTENFVDPLITITEQTYSGAEAYARQQLGRTYITMRGANKKIVVDGASTEYARKMKKAKTEASAVLKDIRKNIVVETKSSGITDIIDDLRVQNELLDDASKQVRKATRGITRTSSKTTFKYKVSDEKMFVAGSMTGEQLDVAWNNYWQAQDSQWTQRTVGDYIAVSGRTSKEARAIPNDVKNIINDTYDNAVSYGVVEADDLPSRGILEYKYNVAKTYDQTIDQRIKRAFCVNTKDVYEGSFVKSLMDERSADIVRNQVLEQTLVLNESMAQSDEIANTVRATDQKVYDVVDDIYSRVVDNMMSSKGLDNVIKNIGDFHDIGDTDLLKQFLILDDISSEKSLKQIRKKIEDGLRSQIKANLGGVKAPDTQINQLAKDISERVATKFEVSYNELRQIMLDFNPNVVDLDAYFKEVDDLVGQIKGAKANRKQFIEIMDDKGRLELIQVDPLLADLVNTSPQQFTMSAAAQINYLWMQTFRSGTTGANIFSMLRQTFRDTMNAFIGGNMYRTFSGCVEDMRGVLGDDVVDFIKGYDPSLAKKVMQGTETADDALTEVLGSATATGRAISPAATETDYMRSLREARTAKFSSTTDRNYFQSAMDRISDGIDKVNRKLGAFNEWREQSLRNGVYMNAFTDAVNQGYSFNQAKIHANYVMNNATTNFNRTMTVLTSFQDNVPYLGAAINGTKSFYRLLITDPVGVVGRMFACVGMPVIYLTGQSLSTEENRKIYRNVPEYMKEDNLVFVVEGQVFTVPIPQEVSAIIAPFRTMVEAMYDGNNKAFWQLMLNDIVGLSPVELSGFLNIDNNNIYSDLTFWDNAGAGITKLWSQLAPAPLKSGVMLMTGIDPYTLRKIDRSYTTVDLDTGQTIIMDTQSGEFAKLLSNIFRGGISAPMAQALLENMFGSASIDMVDWVIGLGQGVVGYNGNNILSGIEVIGEDVLGGLQGELIATQYDQAQLAWNSAVSYLYDKRTEILMSNEWQTYQQLRRNATTSEDFEKLRTIRSNLLDPYFNEVRNMVDNLQSRYGAEFTANKYASVISLMTLSEVGADTASRIGDEALSEVGYDARRQAINTMVRLGFPSSSHYSIFGQIESDGKGGAEVVFNNPLQVLNVDNMRYTASAIHLSNIKARLSQAGLDTSSDEYKKMRNEVSAIYAKENLTSADFDKINDIYRKWDVKVMSQLIPYIEQYGAEAVLNDYNTDLMNYLEEVIKVPSDYMINKQGRYFSAPRLDKNAGFVESYVKYIYNAIKE